MEERVECRSPTPGAKPTSVPKWKYDALAASIIAVLKEGGPSGVPFSDLPQRVRDRLDDDVLSRLGSVGWHVTTVKLEMEVRGDIERIEGSKPQQLRLPG